VSTIREALAVSKDEPETLSPPIWEIERGSWGWQDLLALSIWTGAIVIFFWDAATLKRALFYFDITEINYPYRAFLAEELQAGRFSRWCPGLYCGLPLFAESQAGYLHPFKYLLYPWLATWRAFNLDTVLSIWLTGAGTYLWLRRHVRPAAALTGCAVFGLSGFMWAHLIHTSMLNALVSVPLVIWGLETSWASGRWRGVVAAALAIACQVFAGHLQDTLLTALLVAFYGVYRAITEAGLGRRGGALRMALAVVARPISSVIWSSARGWALGMALAVIGLGAMCSAVQWIPSKELLDRSPRAGGLSRSDLTYGSWHPELLPTLVVREAYGTRARDTDWMDGYYPYHEMNAYMGLIAMGLAVVGAGGIGQRDRWTNFWVLLAGVGGLLMLGRFTCLFDYANRIPILGSSREPVRFHLWVSLAVAALAAVGVERISRPGSVSLRGALILAGALVVASIPILLVIYTPVWAAPRRWSQPVHLARFGWLGKELVMATSRTIILAGAGLCAAIWAVRTRDPVGRARRAAILPLLVIADLMGSHIADVPTVDPRFWTSPPLSAERLKADPSFTRVFGFAEKHAGEPGYASEPVDFFQVRDTLDWSLPPVWQLSSANGNTPMKSSRVVEYSDHVLPGRGRFDLESVTHIVTGRKHRAQFSHLNTPIEEAGSAIIVHNTKALPRARLAGKPVYALNESDAVAVVNRLTQENGLLDHVVVEDPTRPLATSASASGTARIVTDRPERVVVEVKADGPAYLVLADTFDPGWSATLDGQPAPIRPAYIAFRAVYAPRGEHIIIFTYIPAGFQLGLAVSICGALLCLLCCFLPASQVRLASDHVLLDWPPRWRLWFMAGLAAIVLISAVAFKDGHPVIQSRWRDSFHPFTWGAGIDAMHWPRWDH
jgi:hypothetical protein